MFESIAGGICCAGPFFLLTFASSIFWLWALVDCVINETGPGNNRLVWALVILFLHFVGGLLYVLFRRPDRKRELGH